ncbi:hypothetical protein FK545_02335 [Planococcus glaciei]|nr:hypothetical protein [Planococcus glaciei]QDY44778.1 hypothetical protein FK545_02335 [Planococcus glaciei]
MENVIISYFEVESEAYQALSELKKRSEIADQFLLSQAALLKKVERPDFVSGRIRHRKTDTGRYMERQLDWGACRAF